MRESVEGFGVRRVVLMHTLLAFLYNTTILALALNLAFALLAPT